MNYYMWKKINNILFFIGIVAIIVMFYSLDVGFEKIMEYIHHMGYWFAVIILFWGLLYVMNTFAWEVIISSSGGRKIPFHKLLELMVTGFALNNTTPGGLMGGEAYRIMELSRYVSTPQATSSVLLFSMMHVFSHFWFWITGIAAYIIYAVVYGIEINVHVQLILLLSLIFCSGDIYLFLKGYRNGIILRLMRLICGIPGFRRRGKRLTARYRGKIEKIDSQIAALHNSNRKDFMRSFLLEYFGRILQCFEILIILNLSGVGEGEGIGRFMYLYLCSLLILAFTSLFANLLGFLPLQLGGREGGFVMSVTQIGMTADIGLFISMICRLRELCWTTIGLLFMKIYRKEAICTEAEKVGESESE